jgi:hypothetical protein
MAIDLGDTGDLLFPAGLPGMDVDINISSIISHNNGDQPLEPGVAVGVGTDDKLGPPAAGNVVGIVMRHPVYVASEDGQWSYRPHDAVPVMEFGRVWVICQDGCTGREQATCEPDGTVGVGGSIPIDGAFWDSRADAGGIAKLRLNRIKFPAAVAAPPVEADTRTPAAEGSTEKKEADGTTGS